MNTKKALPDDINKFFKGESVFFQGAETNHSPTPSGGQTVTSMKPGAGKKLAQPSPTPSSHKQIPPANARMNDVKDDEMTAPSKAGNDDVVTSSVTSLRQNINLKEWQEIIENTETQNSALRLTSEERYAIEDAVNELRRQYGIKTSMNEIARLGLLVILADFTERRKDSLIYTVKKA